jgi:hypothetical protein
MFRSILVLALFALSTAYAEELTLKDEAHFECSASAGQYWPGSKRASGLSEHLFIETETFKYDYKAATSPTITLTLADFKNRFNGGKGLRFRNSL